MKHAVTRSLFSYEITVKCYTSPNWNFSTLAIYILISLFFFRSEIPRNVISLVIRQDNWLGRGGSLRSNHWHKSSSRKLESILRRCTTCREIKALTGSNLYTSFLRAISVAINAGNYFDAISQSSEQPRHIILLPTNQIWENLALKLRAM